ncbi:hypothetical protein [Haloplasma contractile]|uniref:Uncharacterized protein n=1 Tax=Haloplasma contractile SSD-17B TaxID=1033810 RepID=U2FPI7_9MOLU|nr:hypothetical protein [Haloplasma contractile]ERJ12984.1 hypothetical protein HLPCO_000583 [Haloplasma contractile SSD-17B]
MDISLANDLELKGNQIKSCVSDHVSETFLDTMMNFIITYPLVWKNFVENVLKNSFAVSYEGRLCMIFTNYLPETINLTIIHTLDYVKRSDILESVSYIDGIYYLKFNSENEIEFFKKTGSWLELLTYYTIKHFTEHVLVSQGNIIRLGRRRIHNIKEFDVLGKCNQKYFLIECKDTLNYNEEDYNRLKKFSKKISREGVEKIFITTKYDELMYEKANNYNVTFIHYDGDYDSFKNRLKQLLLNN